MMDCNVAAVGPVGHSSVVRPPAERLTIDDQAFIKDLVSINNRRGVDGIAGRLDERVAWLSESRPGGLAVADGTELHRQLLYRSDLTTLRSRAAVAYIGPMTNLADLRSARSRITASIVAPGLKPVLKATAALAVRHAQFQDDEDLAMAVAKERAANGTHLYVLAMDHGLLNSQRWHALSLAAANGALADLAAGEANIGTIIGQFSLRGDQARDVLQWKAVNGAAGDAVGQGRLTYEQAIVKYGFHLGFDSTRALEAKAAAGLTLT